MEAIGIISKEWLKRKLAEGVSVLRIAKSLRRSSTNIFYYINKFSLQKFVKKSGENSSDRKGKTLEELYGKEKAISLKKNLSRLNKGKNFTQRETRTCACGCGESFEVKITSKRIFYKQICASKREAWSKGLTKETDIRLVDSGRKISDTLKRKYKSGEFDYLAEATSERNIERIQSRKGKFKDTKPELALEAILISLNIKYTPQFVLRATKPWKSRIYDFYLPDYNLLIEVDGIYWHGRYGKVIKSFPEYTQLKQLKQIKRDKYKNKLAKAYKYKIKRVADDEVRYFGKWIQNRLFKMEIIKKVGG